jgi:hypothetical protein
VSESASTADTRDGASPGAAAPEGRPSFSERLYLPWYHWFLPLLAAVLLAAEVHMGYPGVRAWLPYVITIPLTALILWRFGNAKLEVRDGELFAGEAHLPLRFVSEIRVVPQAAKRKVLGPGFDPAAFALHRSWIGSMVWLRLDDPDDPTPYWLISTRSPDRLVEALTSEIERIEPDGAERAAVENPEDAANRDAEQDRERVTDTPAEPTTGESVNARSGPAEGETSAD